MLRPPKSVKPRGSSPVSRNAKHSRAIATSELWVLSSQVYAHTRATVPCRQVCLLIILPVAPWIRDLDAPHRKPAGLNPPIPSSRQMNNADPLHPPGPV